MFLWDSIDSFFSKKGCRKPCGKVKSFSAYVVIAAKQITAKYRPAIVRNITISINNGSIGVVCLAGRMPLLCKLSISNMTPTASNSIVIIPTYILQNFAVVM